MIFQFGRGLIPIPRSASLAGIRMGRRLLSCLALLAGAGVGASRAQAPDPIEAGPFAAEYPTVWETGTRVEALGTLATWEASADTTYWSITPLLSYESTPVLNRERFDLLYPVLTWRRDGTEYRWQLGQLFSFSGANRQSDDSIVHRSIFPLYFEQRSLSATNDYLAIVPFYGHLENRLFRDEIDFYMFPIYSRSRKGEMVTRNYMYPIFHRRTGPGWNGWQFWPLYGTEHKDVGWTTNHLGDRVVSPGRDKWYAMWPFVFDERKNLGTPAASTNRAVLPFYSGQHGLTYDQTTYLWPFFSRNEDRAKGFVEWGAPWPLIGWANGTGKTARRVFPFYGNSQAGPIQSRFYLWPIFTHRSIDDETLERHHWRSVFFFYDDVYLRSKETGNYRRERGVWPFFVWRRDLDGRERFQFPAPVETVLRNREAVQRNYSPLWAFYRAESNPKTGRSSQSVLWNLFRRDVSTNSVRTSCLFGIVKTERTDGGKRRWSLFWTTPRETAESGRPTSAAVAQPGSRIAAMGPKRGDVLAERQRKESPGPWVAGP